MRKGTLSVLAVAMLLIIHLSAQVNSSTSGPKLDDKTEAVLVRMGGQLMIAGKAYEYDRVLADEIGPRITGSSGYVKAVDWVHSEFERLGLTNVRRESWNIVTVWEPETNASAQNSPLAVSACIWKAMAGVYPQRPAEFAARSIT